MTSGTVEVRVEAVVWTEGSMVKRLEGIYGGKLILAHLGSAPWSPDVFDPPGRSVKERHTANSKAAHVPRRTHVPPPSGPVPLDGKALRLGRLSMSS